MRYPKIRELIEAIKALIKGPYTAKFPFGPHEPFERFRGRPQYHEEDCIGCTACVQVCPSDALSFEDRIENGRAVRVLKHTVDVCIFCGQCEANCPTAKGIMLTREFDLATTGKRQDLTHQIEKELILCDCCGETVVPKDQYIWIADKLGPLMFSNPSVFLSYLNKLSLTAKWPQVKKEKTAKVVKRADRFKILCPKCRREAVVKS